ncbi:hypothetical protein Q760_14330 [Cellulomonas cellasea DSM 20118]|uniref:Uncharacterized protein n=3 Tax=Cellulomonas cellasea TaxID=43670 RepID=A0A0A0B660_9CELL|nr:hypothetical protein [Cellulomonas cellasea]KGM02315.1 hypothetical protein Q760_14330 [Cellulomonas cellasea DSM 20118]GEA88173.1 hypothetical protein CCE01nite_21220 [Cellulomonas cellasea]
MGMMRWSVVTAVVVAVMSGSGVLAPAAGLLPPAAGLLPSAAARLGLADACAGAPLDVSYDVVLEPALGGYAVSGVRVSGLPASCADRELWVALTADDGSTLAEVRTTPGSPGVRVGGPLDPAVPASAVAGVSAVLRDAP